jgi:thiamine pyrophosphate-dependent acetolactate synthase large subunit-like protein
MQESPARRSGRGGPRGVQGRRVREARRDASRAARGRDGWKQDKKFGRHFDVGFGNPDFVKLAEAFGMSAWRCESGDDFGRRLRHALTLDVPSLIVVPIDYSIDVAISEQLGAETVAT